MKFPIEKITAIHESGEPLFILRARDNCALAAIAAYIEEYKNSTGSQGTSIVSDDFTRDFDQNIAGRFVAWRGANPDKCKTPD